MMNINEVIADIGKKEVNADTKNRRRGRPRKNDIQTKVKDIPTDQQQIEEDIILDLHISTKELKDDSMNGFEIIKTECIDPVETSDSSSNLSDDAQGNYQQLLKIIQEKENTIKELEAKLKHSSEITRLSENNSNIMKNTSLQLINPFENADKRISVPEFTNVACLWDTCEINGVPCFLPDRYIDNTFHVIGCFCSINCAAAYNLSLDDYKTSERYSLLKWLYGKTNEKIEPSPTFRILDKYGGNINITDYRKNLIKCDKEYMLITAPLTYVSHSINVSTYEKRNQLMSEKRNIVKEMRHKK